MLHNDCDNHFNKALTDMLHIVFSITYSFGTVICNHSKAEVKASFLGHVQGLYDLCVFAKCAVGHV